MSLVNPFGARTGRARRIPQGEERFCPNARELGKQHLCLVAGDVEGRVQDLVRPRRVSLGQGNLSSGDRCLQRAVELAR